MNLSRARESRKSWLSKLFRSFLPFTYLTSFNCPSLQHALAVALYSFLIVCLCSPLPYIPFLCMSSLSISLFNQAGLLLYQSCVLCLDHQGGLFLCNEVVAQPALLGFLNSLPQDPAHYCPEKNEVHPPEIHNNFCTSCLPHFPQDLSLYHLMVPTAKAAISYHVLD